MTPAYSSFDELLELSQRGDNRTIDMLVGDIYGGMDYSKVVETFKPYGNPIMSVLIY